MSELLLTPRRTRVGLGDLIDDGVVLDVDGVELPTGIWPDERSARRVARLATRVLEVELFAAEPHLGPSAWRAEVTAVWHRVPHTRGLSVPAALALLLSGVPTFLVQGGSR